MSFLSRGVTVQRPSKFLSGLFTVPSLFTLPWTALRYHATSLNWKLTFLNQRRPLLGSLVCSRVSVSGVHDQNCDRKAFLTFGCPTNMKLCVKTQLRIVLVNVH
jgi:hypothetical protein